MAQESFYKRFGYNKLEWEIKNYCVTPEVQTNKVFYSPEFYVRSVHLTKWRMIMRRFLSPNGNSAVCFYLVRLQCDPYNGPVAVDCILEYNDHYEETIEIEFKCIFGINLKIKECYLMYSGFSQKKTYHLCDFHLTCHVLVNFNKAPGDIHISENVGLRSLSQDMLQLYEDGIYSDLSIYFGQEQHPTLLHKPIFYFRIGDENLKRRIYTANSALYFSDIDYAAAENVCRFLYSGNMFYAEMDPSISVYRFAKVFDVKPVVAYYEPDSFLFTSAIESEEFYTTWTIHNFSNRNENCLRSPIMTSSKMDTRWQLQIYPKGVSIDTEYVCACLYITTRTTKNICVQIYFVNSEPQSVSYSCHKKIRRSGAIIARKFVPINYVANNFTDLTIALQLQISTGKESCSIDKSISGDYYFYGQRNYERLSEDLLYVYNHKEFNKMPIDFTDHNVTINFHEGIVHERCGDLLLKLKNNNLQNFTNVGHAVLFELFSFLYCGKLRDHLLLVEKFCLFRIARKFNFQSLHKVIEKNLEEILCEPNAKEILEFAISEGLEDLKRLAERY